MSDMGTPGPNHRKVVKLTNYAGNGEDSMPHGSHVVGTILGKSMTDPSNYVKYDGMAYNARVSFMDIFNLDQTQDEIMPPMKDMLGDMYSAGARSHSGSWGGYSNQSMGAYSWRSLGADQYMWDHPDFLGIWAAGNSGPTSGTVGEPGTAKSIVTVGASSNGDTKNIASFSSNGPTTDNVRKPTILAPGSGIMSVSGDTTLGNYNQDYRSMSGTSMATPTTSGGTALVEQYFRDGFYPSGKKNQADGFIPSGALRKAILINSAWDQYGGSNVDNHIPDNSQGWGKIKLDDALYFSGDARKLWIDDAGFSQGINTGDKVEYAVNVSGSEPFKVTLVWNDFPGKGLINDLDLKVTAPNSTAYLGNVFSNGQSVSGGQPEKANNDEQVLISAPAAGLWSVEITAVSVPKGPQPYALVVTGGIVDASKKSGSSGPSVLSTDPKNKASSVPVTATVSVTFDKTMNASSAQSAFSMSPSTNGTYSWNGNTMTFKPDKSLLSNTSYTVTEAKGASDQSGNKMSSDYTFSFKTEEVMPVEVLGTIPLNSAVDVPLSSTIRVVFNKGVVPSTAEPAFSIAPTVSGTFSWPNNYTMVLTPGTPLLEKTKYAATVAKTVQDQKGDTMTDDYKFSFTTGYAPDVTAPDVKIKEPANGASVSNIVAVKADATDARGVVQVEFYLDGTITSTAFMQPYVWTWDTKKTSNGAHAIKAMAYDAAGNVGTDQISVTVNNDLTIPTITGTDPKDAAVDVALGATVSITFSKEMDRASVENALSITPGVAGTFSWSSSTVTFKPANELLPDTTYKITVETGAKDMDGNALTSAYTFSFKTRGATSGFGIGFEQTGFLVLLIAVVVIIAVVVVLALRKRRKRAALDQYQQAWAQPYQNIQYPEAPPAQPPGP
jgi:hypothetical protein